MFRICDRDFECYKCLSTGTDEFRKVHGGPLFLSSFFTHSSFFTNFDVWLRTYQLLWLTREMVGSGVAGADRVCFALLKHLPGETTSLPSLSLSLSLHSSVSLLSSPLFATPCPSTNLSYDRFFFLPSFSLCSFVPSILHLFCRPSSSPLPLISLPHSSHFPPPHLSLLLLNSAYKSSLDL